MSSRWSLMNVVKLLRKPSKRSNHESGEDGRDIGSPRHAPERRESGRFPSAARLLRSLGRSNRDDSGSGAQGRDSDARLSRANPSYHSEGKGLKKKNNWTSERELNHSLSPAQKERSHSFCEKSNSASKRRYSYHDNKTLREETRGRLERQESNHGGSSTLASPTHSLDQSHPPTSTPLSSHPPQPPISTSATTPPPCTPSPAASSSSSPSSSSSSSTTPTLPKSVSSQPPSPIDNSQTENIYENLPPRKVKNDTANNDGEGGHGRVVERGERERRSSRKLTKDSGYETSPYSESDYANIDLYSEVDASGEVEGDGDDVTLAPESELASPPSPSVPRHPDPGAAPLPPRPPTHHGRMSHDSLERRCSWQEQNIQDALGDANISPTEGRSATPSPRLERAAAQGVVLEANSSFVRNLCGRSSRRSPLPRYSSAESLSSFAESLVSPGSTASGVASSSLVPAKSTPSLHQDASHGPTPARNPAVNVALHVSRSTPNLDDPDDGGSTSSSMVTKSSMYSYLHGASTSTSSKGGSGAASGRYWDPTMGSDDTPDREDYAHHLRSSSYQMLHSRQLSALSTGSAGSYHSRQHSNASNYSEPDDLSPRGDMHHHSAPHSHHHHHHGMDRARFFSYDNLGPDGSSSTSSQKYHVSWNVSEPDLTLAPPPYSPPGPGFQQVVGPPVSPKVTSPAPTTSTSSPTSTSNTTRHPASPPPPPVRDASSLKYIKYGPGHEKYPSWPVPAANQVLTLAPAAHDANVSGLPDSPPQSSGPQGSHRSKSWTEQSEYPKEKAAGYARPYSNKKPANRQLKTVIERAEKIPKEMFHTSGLRDDVFAPSSNYSFMDAYYKPSSSPYYPLYDREGRALDDKDYSIPSPPERDLGMGEASLGQVTAAQLEEYVRRYEEFGYTDLIGTTPLLDQLRRESVMWDGGSERDSGRGESESVAESARYSNGRESVTTVVTNSSSASSSETLKWHGSLSDISIMSGHSRDPRGDHNIAHSARVQAPQRHNSESVLYYGPEGRPKGSGSSRHSHDTREHHRRPHPADPGYPRHPREGGKWSREVVERNNEMNNLKKFPSYSYTQPLSQITESPTAEMRETTRSPQSPTIDFSKPPTVAERIHELEKQSRTSGPESGARWPRDQSGSRERDHQDHRKVREESALQDPRDAIEKTEARSPREASETRTHQRRGSRDSQRGDRDLRLDFANTSSRKGDTSLSGVELCSPTTPTGSASTSSRSPTQRDAESRTFIHENFQNILNSFTEVDRSDRSSGVSYSYLDPEKRRKVPDSTLKSIQKQAVMSFYERHAGRNLGVGTDVSSSGSQSSLTSSHSAPEMHQGKWANASHASQSQNLRTDKSGRAGKGVARLGRVPESEDDQPLRPGRRRSSGRLDSSSEISAEDASRGDSQRSSLASESTSSRGEQPPALPQKMSLQSQPEGTPWSSPSLPPINPAPEDAPATSTCTTTSTTTSTTPGEDQAPQDAPAEDDRTYHKDSYMAHRRDWKTGFEGRYRRTISPSGSSRNLLSSTTTTTTTAPASLYPTSSTITATTTTTTTTTTTSSCLLGQNDTHNENEIITSENGWSNGGHMRNTSTTVSFTAEELRAFKARRAHAQDLSTHTPDKENTSRKLHSSQSSPSLSSSALQSVASEGSTSSLASGGTVSSLGSGRSVGSVCSGGVSPVSPSKLSPAHSWRTSLESLNRANSTTVSSSISNGNSGSSSHSPRTITRATSLADPLHSSEEVGMSGRATQDSYQLPRTASINESLSRITAISDSLSRSTSVADSLAGQSFAAETHSQGNNNTEMLLPCQSAEPSSLPLAPASPTSPVAHDGPVTARPATVTEEATSPVMPPIKAAQVSSLSVASKSPTSSKSASSTIHAQATPAIKSSSPVTTNTFSEGMNSNPATCSSTDSNSNYDVVVLGYGRTPYPEELECDRLSKDYVPQFPMDNKLRALFATGPEHKTTAFYMEGVFSLELRKDFISSSHARHPDLVQVGLSQTAAAKSVSNIQNNNETTNGVDTMHDRTPLPADSAYFTTSESKAKMLTRLRGSTGNLQESLTDQQLMKKKEELVASIGRKLEILKAEHEAIKDEMRLNHDLGAEVTTRVEAMARLAESEKYKLHVEEIDKITSLLLGLSGRLARAENALMMVDDNDLEEKRILENKRDKLLEQLEEAKKLKENIDRRAVQVSKVLNKYLTEDQYADYDHFIKMKAKLIMDAKEIDDKIKLGEEQQKALRETLFKKQ
ncbi:serine-rich adhesin for platelets-like isoform X4 [Portunus trituberculatus]|uniref:serine-rich adhesin for platelets-like isoform X4 n=1 Tax=Portunus trituberculatus TaxID=210409 RepID=UPI001E1CB13F|nr:serine-rich adhesin for platelets-like isoform X4 [Portunus trituberculatus]